MAKAGVAKCTFCNANRPLTKEHIFRQSWKNHFGKSTHNIHEWGWQRDDSGQAVHDSRSYRKVGFEQTVKAFCGRCNNGWMNDLEQEAGNLVLALAKGEDRNLTPEDLATITRWAAKTAFVVETTLKANQTSREDQYIDLQQGKVPARFHFWMYPVIANPFVKTRSTPIGLTDRGPYRSIVEDEWRLTSILFYQVHMLSIHSSNEKMDDLLAVLNIPRICGNPVSTRHDGWTWPPAQPTPAFLTDEMHSLVVNYISGRLREAGMEAWNPPAS
ncbi:hypothetical protein GA0070616_4911 [Micromonospora nigra]|uniref:HNH endonuclease n=1 Tax=Micromonospora nigra TaxID=145857 RepID=A0A1C6SXF8_9ACTN|nr:hypothetical protein [Micromonospora nigra]SCL34207.1 hypothetical protein GA0070616_4911 [Micromonospora nigra]